MDLEPLRIDRSKTKRQRRGRGAGGSLGWPWLWRGVGLALVVGAAWLFGPALLAVSDRVRLPKVKTRKVFLSSPAEVGAVRGLAANGYVVAARRAALSADTPGRIVELNVTEGSAVAEGFVVARLFAEEFAAAVRQAEANVQVSQAALRQAEADLAAAEAELNRLEQNARAAKAVYAQVQADRKLAQARFDRAEELQRRGVASSQDFDDAEGAIRAAEARLTNTEALRDAAAAAVASGEARLGVVQASLEVAQTRVEVAQASLAQARATLSKTEVRAPFAGVVVLKDAEVGEVVSPNSGGGTNARGSVVTMVDFQSLEVQADVPETSLRGVKVGGRASIFLDAYPEVTYPGQVDRIWPTADRQKATVEVRVKFDAPDERLRPEMGVRVVFLPDDAEPAEATASEQPPAQPVLLLPEDALVKLDGQRGTFVVERGQVRFQVLELGERQGGQVAVLSGLSDGDEVVMSPPPSLGDGDRIQLED